jgi:tetratricopeptide (TPR) repeat protein
MIGPGRRSLVAALTVVALLTGAAVGVEVARDRAYGEPAPGDTVLYVRSPEAVKRLSLSYASLMADIYWIRTLQYYGGMRLATDRRQEYNELFPLLDITTTLDPRFRIAYRFGAIFLAEPRPGGAGRPDQAVALLQKGVQAEPKYWRYLQDIGFVYYWWVGDFTEAASWFTRAAGIPGAPWWLRSLAAVTRLEGGDRRGSRLLWQSLLSSADNEWLRSNAQLRLAQIDALEAIDRLNHLLDSYERRTGTRAASWQALVSTGVLRGQPVDPTGRPYVIDPLTGRAALDSASTLNPLPVGAHAAAGTPRGPGTED